MHVHICVFVLQCLIFSELHLWLMLHLEIINSRHKQNWILLIIRQHDDNNNNNNSYLWNKPITMRGFLDSRY